MKKLTRRKHQEIEGTNHSGRDSRHPGRYWMGVVGRFFRHLWLDFRANGCQQSAAALTYMTLFAIVPLMTVIYAMFSLVPDFGGIGDQLQQLIFSHMVPESGHVLSTYLADFSAQARSLTGAGIGILVFTAYMMLTNIEKTFNNIWGVRRSRRGLSSFLLYWAVLSLGPLLLGVGLAMNTYMLSLKLMVDEYQALLGFSNIVFRSLPFFTTVGAFTLLFVAVPNCRVPFRYALIGGLVTTLCFEVIKDVFTLAMANSSFQLVYGAFAVVPLFLLWVNLTWTTILAGAIFVRTLAEQRYFIDEGKVTDMVATLRCLVLFRQSQQEGFTVSDADCYRLGLGVVHWQYLRERLEKHRWIIAASNGKYVLLRDLSVVTLWDLASVLELQLRDLDQIVANPPDAPWFGRYAERRKQLAGEAKEVFGISIEQLLTDTPIASEKRVSDASLVAG